MAIGSRQTIRGKWLSAAEEVSSGIGDERTQCFANLQGDIQHLLPDMRCKLGGPIMGNKDNPEWVKAAMFDLSQDKLDAWIKKQTGPIERGPASLDTFHASHMTSLSMLEKNPNFYQSAAPAETTHGGAVAPKPSMDSVSREHRGYSAMKTELAQQGKTILGTEKKPEAKAAEEPAGKKTTSPQRTPNPHAKMHGFSPS